MPNPANTGGASNSAVVLDNRLNRMPTPMTLEWAFGDDVLFFGSDVFATDLGLPEPQTPAEIIVRAAYNIQIPAYAVYQPGGTPVLPSVVFQSTGVVETESFSRGHLETQDFTITVRARLYSEVEKYTDMYFASLRAEAGSRYNGISGQWTDEFLPALNYRERTFSVTLRR